MLCQASPYLPTDFFGKAAEQAVWTVIPAQSETFVYDDAGRLVEDGIWTCTWDAGGRLTGLARKAGTAADPEVTAETISYRYDADGRRTGRTRTVTKTGNVQQTEKSKVLWDGWLPLCEDRTVNEAPQPRRWFVWGEDVSGTRGGAGGIGGLLAIVEEGAGGRTLLPVEDSLGNITAVINQATGSVVARYDYGPYGEIVGESGEVEACPFRYQSKWWDGAAGLNYFGYRHYSPRLGRDPLGEEGGMNLYAYCGGDPVNKYDYLGMEPQMAVHRDSEGELLLSLMTRVVDGVPQVKYSDWAHWYGPLVGGAVNTWWQPANTSERARLFRLDAGGWHLATDTQRHAVFNRQVNETMPEAMRKAQGSLEAFGVVNGVAAVGTAVAVVAAPALPTLYGAAQYHAANSMYALMSGQAAIWGTRAAVTVAGGSTAVALVNGASPLDAAAEGAANGLGIINMTGYGDPRFKIPSFRLPSWRPQWNPLSYQFYDPKKVSIPLLGINDFKYIGPAAKEGFIDPSKVRFTQDSIGAAFKNGQSIDDVARALRGPGGADLAREFPAIRLVERDGQLFTLDNRRLATFSAGGQHVPYRMATPAEIAKEWGAKFTTTAEQGWGQFISVRPPRR